MPDLIDLSPAMRRALVRLDEAEQKIWDVGMLQNKPTNNALIRRGLISAPTGPDYTYRLTPKGREVAAVLR